MTWLHCLQPEPIIHRDLKPANVLVTKDGNVKVCDFGLSCVREKFDPSAPPKETVSGTALYLVLWPRSSFSFFFFRSSSLSFFFVLRRLNFCDLFSRRRSWKECPRAKSQTSTPSPFCFGYHTRRHTHAHEQTHLRR
jgi:serine/threonine protein kinase